MRFVHDDPGFPDLLRIVAAPRGLPPGFVEKDYWVTHTLWAMQAQGLGLWFKGGTSLSKAYDLIQRFSEDLDLRIDAGSVAGIPPVSSWKSEGSRATASRLAFFEALQRALVIPGAEVALDREQADRSHRSGMFRVRYPGAFLADLGGVLRDYVLLEVGSARVTPFVERDLGSFVHDHLAQSVASSEFEDNRALGVRCVHPLVTLIEKLDALSRRFPRADLDAAAFVRHYEDAARIVGAAAHLPPLATSARALAEDLLREKQVRALPASSDPAFAPDGGGAWDAVRAAQRDIAPMFWGEQLTLEVACERIRGWIRAELE